MSKRVEIPADVAGQIALVGTAVFGADYRSRLAAAIGVSRTTLFELQRGRPLKRGRRVCNDDLRGRLIDVLLRHEEDLDARGLEVAKIRAAFVALGRGPS